MTGSKRYLLGFALVAGCGFGLATAAHPAARQEIACGVLLGLVLQAPLGWWTLRSIGTDRFQLVWVIGMLTRLGLLILTGFLVPAFGWALAPVLGGLVGALLLLLLVEVVTAMGEQSGVKVR